MFCRTCGTQLEQTMAFCPKCGTSIQGTPVVSNPSSQAEESTVGWLLLGFFLPLVGFIIWLVWRNDKPARSKAAGKGALIGMIVSVAVGIITGIVALVWSYNLSYNQSLFYESWGSWFEESGSWFEESITP